MKEFFILEGAYLILAFLILLVTLFVTTRPFMSKKAPKKGLISVGLVLAFFIFLHFYLTTNRINSVKKAFLNGEKIICESRANTKAAQSIIIKKDFGWSIKGDYFISPNYIRDFHIARCIIY